MTDVVHAGDLTDREKRLLFWASFLSLAAAGAGFAFRIAKQGDYGKEFTLTYQEVGSIMGASFWPIAVTMILFSLVVDRTGYKRPMYLAFLLQGASGVLFLTADGYQALYYASVCAGLGHGIVEAVINPVCAAVYPKDKTTRLTILHAAWPAGVAGGTLLIMGGDAVGIEGWRVHALWILLPTIAYAVMYLPCRLPVDERVQAGVPFRQMLQQVGFLSATLASSLLVYELGNVSGLASGNWLRTSMIVGLVIGAAFGFAVRSLGRPLFFMLCVLMIPVATAELSTDGWIQKLVGPAVESLNISASFAIVFSAGVMLTLRVFAGGILRFFSPPALLSISGLLSAVGLYWLSNSAVGVTVFIAFLLYAIGQTYYWPCILGFTAERYPEGGALTLNTVSAMGLLSLGVIGNPILGVEFDKTIHTALTEESPSFVEKATVQGSFLGMTHDTVDPNVLIAPDEDKNSNTILDREERTAGMSGEALESLQAAWAWIDGLPENERQSVMATYAAKDAEAGRAVLAYAVRFPALLVIAFGAIFLWFRSRGGYKPIELDGKHLEGAEM
ncbi:MAG: MFS transporter [bacterium]|nr:MFS transporter [bacterium]